jgi:hypothetical protein
MGKIIMKPRKSEAGQTALEFMLIAGMLFGAIFLILGITLGWHTHALASALALEGAAREGIDPGSGFSLIEQNEVPGNIVGGFSGTVHEEGRTGKLFTVTGGFDYPMEPLGFNLDTNISSGVIAPEWEFVP